jgi:hypothetical protein
MTLLETKADRPIVSYQNQGTLKPGVDAAEHALVYTSSKPPQPLKDERLDMHAIKVEPEGRQKLSATSRINFGKVYTVEHTAKVCSLGKIAREHRQRLTNYFKQVRESRAKASHSDDEEDEDEENDESESDESEEDAPRSSPTPSQYDR